MTFEEELRTLINCHCLENASNSPDFILAEFILDSLDAFDSATKRRDEFYGEDHSQEINIAL